MKTRELYRLVRYSPTRPKRWTLTNRSKTFIIEGVKLNHFNIEKALLALIKTRITQIDLKVEDEKLVVTSSQAKFVYKFKPVKAIVPEKLPMVYR